MIPQNVIDQILQTADIVEVVSGYVTLKKAGSSHKGLCPFHHEKTPSFNVNEAKQIYHCFGCGAGGSVIGFLMQMERLSFPEAVEKLAGRLGIKIGDTGPKESPHAALYKINTYAQWFFVNELETRAVAGEYLSSRGIFPEIAKRFGLGLAPDDFHALEGFLGGKKVPLAGAELLGLIRKKDNGHYDFFRNRLIFAIYDSKGRVSGFSGRDLSGSSPAKYVNSPESPIYHKGQELYGLYQAKKAILARRQAIVVEGNVDVIACVQLGFENTVAPLGTSLTVPQVQALKKIADEIVLMFDGDAAGRQAATRAVELCLAQGTHPRVVALPDGTDPGDLLKSADAATKLTAWVEKAPHAMDWIFAAFMKKATGGGVARSRVVKSLVAWIGRLPDAFEKLEYRKKLSNYFEIALQDVDKLIAKPQDFVKTAGLVSVPLEYLLTWLYVQNPGAFPDGALGELGCAFEDGELRLLAQNLEAIVKKEATFGLALTISQVPIELQRVFSRVMMAEYRAPDEYDVGDCIRKFKRLKGRERLKGLTARLLEAETSGDGELKQGLLAEKQKLLGQGI